MTPGAETGKGGPGPDRPVAATRLDYLWFVGLALDQMVAIVRSLGNVGANRRPPLDGANSAFAILTHCLGVMEFWGGCMVAEREITRDRDAEFRATGELEALIGRTDAARRRLEADMMQLDWSAAPPDILGPDDAGTPFRTSKGAALLHIMEELFQHLGQMEITRDVLLAEQGSAAPPIACTLGPEELPQRAREWGDFFRAHVFAAVLDGATARLELAPSPEALVEAASLSRREKECCAFFDFSIDIGMEQQWLVVTVPADATESLASFMTMLGAA